MSVIYDSGELSTVGFDENNPIIVNHNLGSKPRGWSVMQVVAGENTGWLPSDVGDASAPAGVYVASMTENQATIARLADYTSVSGNVRLVCYG